MRHGVRQRQPLRLLIVEPHGPLREALKRLLELYRGCSVVGEAKDREDTLAQVAALRPDLVIFDLTLAGGLATLGDLVGRFPQVKVAVLLSDYTREYQAAALARGAFACIDKQHLEEHLAWTIAEGRSATVR